MSPYKNDSAFNLEIDYPKQVCEQARLSIKQLKHEETILEQLRLRLQSHLNKLKSEEKVLQQLWDSQTQPSKLDSLADASIAPTSFLTATSSETCHDDSIFADSHQKMDGVECLYSSSQLDSFEHFSLIEPLEGMRGGNTIHDSIDKVDDFFSDASDVETESSSGDFDDDATLEKLQSKLNEIKKL